MLEYCQSYFKVKHGEFTKAERDLISVTLKKCVTQERNSIELLDHLVETPKLNRYKELMQQYLDKLKEEMKAKLTLIIQMLQTQALTNSENAESKAFFYNLIGDFQRYQTEIYRVEDNVP